MVEEWGSLAGAYRTKSPWMAKKKGKIETDEATVEIPNLLKSFPVDFPLIQCNVRNSQGRLCRKFIMKFSIVFQLDMAIWNG